MGEASRRPIGKAPTYSDASGGWLCRDDEAGGWGRTAGKSNSGPRGLKRGEKNRTKVRDGGKECRVMNSCKMENKLLEVKKKKSLLHPSANTIVKTFTDCWELMAVLAKQQLDGCVCGCKRHKGGVSFNLAQSDECI